MLKKICLLLMLVLLPTLACAEKFPEPTDKKVVFETSLGKIVIEVYEKEAPITAVNFLNYVKEKFYDGLIFHRIIPSFVVQGGGFEPGMKMRTPTHPPIKNEADNGLKNRLGTLSMARTNRVDSATSQFFINLKDNTSLDHRGKSPGHYGYAVFGRVIEGMDIVKNMAKKPTGSNKGFRDVPQEDIVIQKAYVAGSKK